MVKQQLYSTRALSLPLMLCLLAISAQIGEIQAWTAGPFFSLDRATLSKHRSAIGSFASFQKPPSSSRSWQLYSPSLSSRTALFEGGSGDDATTETMEEMSPAEEMKMNAKRIRLQAEEMEMKLIQEKLEGLTKKLDKLDKKLANVEPAEKEKNLKLIEEKMDMTRQIQSLEYRLNPDAASSSEQVSSTETMSELVAVEPTEGKEEEGTSNPEDMVTMSVNLDNNSIQFLSVNKGNKTLANLTGDMSEEEWKEGFSSNLENIENVVFTVGEEGFNMESVFNDTLDRDCLWQSNETEFVGQLSKEDLSTIDELEQKWLELLKLRDATKNKKNGKNRFDIAISIGNTIVGEDEVKEPDQNELVESLNYANKTFAEARAGNISSDELTAIRIVNGAINYCQKNLPFVVEVAMNLVESFKVEDEDPIYMERFNLFSEAFDSSLFSLRRNRQEDGIEEVFCKEVLDPNPKLFSRTAKPRQVGSAFLFDGKVVEADGNKVVSGLKEAIEKSSLKDKITLFYLRDPSPQIELDEVQQADYIQTNGGDDDIGRALELVNGFEPPALLITGKNLETDKPIDTRVGITTFALLNLVTTIGAFYYPNVEPDYIQEFVAGIQSPILVYLLGTFVLQHVIQLLLALKGGFKISPLPTLFPGLWGIPLVGSTVSINSPPKNKNDMFDFGFLGPFVGFLISYGFIVLGLESTMQMTNTADFAQLPHIELEALKQSFLTSATIESLMGTNMLLSMGDAASSTVPLDPMVIAGHLGLMINAMQMIPTLVETNGGRAASSALGRFSVGFGGLVGLSSFFLLVQAYRGGTPTLDFLVLLYTFRYYFGPEMPCQNDVDTASSARLVALGISLALACLTLSPA